MPEESIDTIEEIVEYDGGHMRVLGPPASGKSTLLRECFRRGGKRVTIVTYTRESQDRLTDELLSTHSARFGALPIHTYHALANKILRAAPNSGGGLRIIGELEEAVVLRRLLRSIEARLVSDFRRTLLSGAFQEQVLGVVNALLQNGVGEACREELLHSAASPRVRDLVTIYFEFLRHLGATGCCTYYDAAWRAAGIAADRPDVNPLRDVDVLLVEDFQDVDAGQFALIEALAPPAGRTRVTVFGDPTGARFRNQGTTDRYLTDVFPREYRPRDVVLPAGCANGEVLGPVVDRLLVETVGEDAAKVHARRPAGDGGVDASLAIADDEVAEAAHVAGRVADLVRSSRYRPEDVAVAVRDKRRYEHTLSAAFRERGVSLDTGRRPQHPGEFLVYSLLRLLDDPGGESARNAVAKSPFFESLCSVYRKEAGLLEAGLDEDGEVTVEDVRDAMHRASVEQNGSFDLAPLLDHWLRPVLAAAGVDGGTDLLAFLGGLTDEWRTYATAVEGTRGRPTVREFLALGRTLSPRPGAVRSRPGRVGLYSIHELSSRRAPVVIVVGCSELIFPAVPTREDYIPWSALQEVVRGAIPDRPVELFRARSSADFLSDEYALMFTALSRSGERLELTAPRQFGGHVTPAPARVLASMHNTAIRERIGREPSVTLRFAASVAGAAEDFPPTGNLVADLWNRGAPETGIVRREHTRLSPSSLTTFTLCHRKYFYARVLKVEGERSPAMAFGTAFHEMMNRLSEENRTHEELNAAIRSPHLDELIDEVIHATGFAEAANVERESARHHLRAMALHFLDLDGARRDGYRIESSEQYLRFEHGGSQFHGVADRIDRTGSGKRVVIDYKSGKMPKTGKTIRKKALAGFDKPEDRLWQVPIYARGAGAEEGGYPETFCYYVIRPDGDDVVVGVVVGGEDDAAAVAESLGVATNRIGYMTPGELGESLDEAAEVARDVFADRERFARTTERDRCTRCDFRRVCERTS